MENRQSILQELRDNEQLVNCTILTEDGGIFRVHFEIVAGRSPYLKDKPMGSILIPGVSKRVIANIIDFIYTNQLRLSYEGVEELVNAGELLRLHDVTKLCKKFLASNLDDQRCIAIYNFAKRHQFKDLMETAKSYTLKRFQQVFPVSSDYLDLQEDDLLDILSSDTLNVVSEDYVFWAIMRWIEKYPTTRTKSLPNLLRCIRFGLCTPEFYQRNIITNAYVSDNEECQAIVLQASHLLADVPPGSDVSRANRMLDLRYPFLRPRTPNEIVFVMGGWSAGSATNVIETYDDKSERWFLSLSTDSIPRAYHGMLWHKGHIYVIGGFDGNQCFNTVRRYDPVSHIWEEKGCMHEQRCYVSVAAVGNYIYAMGGYDGRTRNKTCERYDPETNQWDMMARMNQVRSDASADALHDKIYIAGGFNGQQVLNSAECYDPETDQWTAITNMHSPRSGVKLVAYADHLYIIGGFNGNSRLATVDKYDPRTRLWTPVTSMHSSRSNFATAILFDCLYVIGGFNGISTIAGVERYSHQTNTWSPVTELNLNRSALSACTVKDIPNPHEYTFIGVSWSLTDASYSNAPYS